VNQNKRGLRVIVSIVVVVTDDDDGKRTIRISKRRKCNKKKLFVRMLYVTTGLIECNCYCYVMFGLRYSNTV